MNMRWNAGGREGAQGALVGILGHMVDCGDRSDDGVCRHGADPSFALSARIFPPRA